MNLYKGLNHSLLTDYTSNQHDSSYSVTSNSFSVPKSDKNFSSLYNFGSQNTVEHSLGTEQTFRNTKAQDSPKGVYHKVLSEKKSHISNSCKKGHNSMRNLSSAKKSREYGSLESSPIKGKAASDVSAKENYLPLGERLAVAKAELSEKAKEIQELKELNYRLACEVKSHRDKQTHRADEVENKFRKFDTDLSRLSYQEVMEKYYGLIACYKDLLAHNIEIEESLRLETLRSEEQRAYIKVLKQKVEGGSSRREEIPFLKKMQQQALRFSQASKLPAKSQNNENEGNSRVGELMEAQNSLKESLEALKYELKEANNEKESWKNQVEKYRSEADETREVLSVVESENERLNQENKFLSEQIATNRNVKGIKEYERLQMEVKRIQEQKNNIEEVLEKEKDSILTALSEKDNAVNELMEEKEKLSQEIMKYRKVLSDVNERVSTTMSEYQGIKEHMEALKRDLDQEKKKSAQLENELIEARENKENFGLESDKREQNARVAQKLKEKLTEREELLKNIEILGGDDSFMKENYIEDVKKYLEEDIQNVLEKERENLELENPDLEEILQENQNLETKVHFLEEKVKDLEKVEAKNTQLTEYIRHIYEQFIRACEEVKDQNEYKKTLQDLQGINAMKVEDIYQKSLALVKGMVENNKKCLKNMKKAQSEGETIELLKWKEEARILAEKVKVLTIQVDSLNEEQEDLYKRLSEAETEATLLKLQLERKAKDNDSFCQEEITSKEITVLRGQLKANELEIEQLRGLIFNEEALDLIEEVVKLSYDMMKIEEDLPFKIKRGKRCEEEVQKAKDGLEEMRVQKKALFDEIYDLKTQEQRKYENVFKLEQQNFQLQNEVSRLMSEIEVNFSKFDGSTSSEYYSYKLNEKQSQLVPNVKKQIIKDIKEKKKEKEETPEDNKEKLLVSNLIKNPDIGLKAPKKSEDYGWTEELISDSPLDAVLSKMKRRKVDG